MINKYFEKTPVILLDLEGRFINEFESMNEASRKLNINQGIINNILSGKQLKTKGNYFFVNKNYYSNEKNYSLKFRKSRKNLLRKLKINNKVTSEIIEK